MVQCKGNHLLKTKALTLGVLTLLLWSLLNITPLFVTGTLTDVAPMTPGDNIPSKGSIQLPRIPEVVRGDDGQFYSVRSSTGDSEEGIGSSATAYGRSFSISTSVPSVWTRTEDFRVDVHVYLTGYLYADITIKFEGYDNFPGPSETREVYKTKSVRAYPYHSVHTLWCYLPSTASVGLKRAEVRVTGLAYYKYGGISPDGFGGVSPMAAPGLNHDYVSRSQVWDYEFVARYGLSDLQTYGGLPPGDAMSSQSGNPNYYWEGLSNDGYNIPVAQAMHRPTEWPIIYKAGYLVDNHVSYPEYSAVILTGQVHDLITYYANTETLKTTNADIFTWDEFAVVLCSFLRVMNIPSRLMTGWDDYYSPISTYWLHAWCEVYVSGGWHHCDSTWDRFDEPWCYMVTGVTIDALTIFSGGDDGPTQWSIYDGNAYNGKLDGKDWRYDVEYDGPNNY